MRKFVKFFLWAVLILEIVSIFMMLCALNQLGSDLNNFNYPPFQHQPKKEPEKEVKNNIILPPEEKKPVILPEKFLIENVPFVVQSPDSAWDEKGEESCEEVSMMIVDHFWTKKPLDRKIALLERNKLIDFEINTYGDFRDENAQQVAQRLKDYFGYQNVEIVYDFSLQDLKWKIIEGRPIIVPAAGRMLNNPYFTQPGPLYHNLVVIGYEGKNIIVNDPGIGRGKGYRYNEDIFYDAIHDFPGSKERITEGRKAMIIVKQ